MNVICNHDCFNCPYPDCINDDITREELKASDALDKEIKWQNMPVIDTQQLSLLNVGAYYKANIDRIRAYGRAYYKDNKERMLAYAKAYREVNKERIRAYTKAWREANKGYKKAYYEANKGLLRAYAKAYYEANKEQISARNKARYATKKLAKACNQAA